MPEKHQFIMKKLIYTLLLTVFGIIGSANAQSFGPDVIITPDTVDQRNLELATAFNGWIFAAYSMEDTGSNKGGISIRRSTDGGYTWTVIDQYFVEGVRYPSHDIVVTGTTETDLKLFLIGVNNNLAGGTYTIFVDTYDADAGTFTGSNYNLNKGTQRVNDVEIASDYNWPAVGAAPYSVAFLYSCFGPVSDSVISVVSLDGGASFTSRNTVYTTTGFTRNITLDYGRSSSASNGRYFAAWEQLSAFTNRNGHIYTSRNTSTVDGTWITPENLDSLSSSMINLCRNPRIAVQHNDIDNDSASVTAIVLVERDYNADGTDYDLLGFYNKRAHFTNFWYRLDVVNTGEKDIHPDIVYDNVNDMFHAVYFDSTNMDLQYATQPMNLTNPSSWTFVQNGMNDTPAATVHPQSRIVYRPNADEVGIGWIDESATGDGIAKIDMENFISADVNEAVNEHNMALYPNPVQTELFIELDDQMNASSAEWTITDMNGRIVLSGITEGQNTIQVSVNELKTGAYLIRFANEKGFATRMFVKK